MAFLPLILALPPGHLSLLQGRSYLISEMKENKQTAQKTRLWKQVFAWDSSLGSLASGSFEFLLLSLLLLRCEPAEGTGFGGPVRRKRQRETQSKLDKYEMWFCHEKLIPVTLVRIPVAEDTNLGQGRRDSGGTGRAQVNSMNAAGEDSLSTVEIEKLELTYL